jgi:hypothetical protein
LICQGGRRGPANGIPCTLVSRLVRIEQIAIMDETKRTPFSTASYQLTHSLLSIRMDAASGRSLVRIPANSIVERTMSFSAAPGFTEVLWQHGRYLVFARDLEQQNCLSDPGSKTV